MYLQYKFPLVPIAIGTLSYAPKYFEMYGYQLGFNKIETEK